MVFPAVLPLVFSIPFFCTATSIKRHTSTPPSKPNLQPQPLNVTALTGNANNESALECWSIAKFTISSTPGTQGALVASLAKPSAFSLIVIPGMFDGGLHVAPAVQWVYFTSGKAVITLPTSEKNATVMGGMNGLILAADTANVSRGGHTTVYPSMEQTVAVVLPLDGGKVPAHEVLHEGACVVEELELGSRGDGESWKVVPEP